MGARRQDARGATEGFTRSFSGQARCIKKPPQENRPRAGGRAGGLAAPSARSRGPALLAETLDDARLDALVRRPGDRATGSALRSERRNAAVLSRPNAGNAAWPSGCFVGENCFIADFLSRKKPIETSNGLVVSGTRVPRGGEWKLGPP